MRDSLKVPIPKIYEDLAQNHDEITRKKEEADQTMLGTGEFPNPDYQACASPYSTEYLNRADVQNAIFVNASETSTWHDCSESV